MSKQIQAQAAKLWETVADPKTAETYKVTGLTTWAIIKETAYLLWLVICLVLVLGEWLWKFSFQAGQTVRNWVNTFEQEKPSVDSLFSATGKNLLAAGKSGVEIALSTAKDQLGIENPPEPAPAPEPKPHAIAPEPVKVPEVAKAVAPEPKPAPPVAPPASPSPEPEEKD